jgi:hypothetical protein
MAVLPEQDGSWPKGDWLLNISTAFFFPCLYHIENINKILLINNAATTFRIVVNINNKITFNHCREFNQSKYL